MPASIQSQCERCLFCFELGVSFLLFVVTAAQHFGSLQLGGLVVNLSLSLSLSLCLFLFLLLYVYIYWLLVLSIVRFMIGHVCRTSLLIVMFGKYAIQSNRCCRQ